MEFHQDHGRALAAEVQGAQHGLLVAFDIDAELGDGLAGKVGAVDDVAEATHLDLAKGAGIALALVFGGLFRVQGVESWPRESKQWVT